LKYPAAGRGRLFGNRRGQQVFPKVTRTLGCIYILCHVVLLQNTMITKLNC